MINLLKYKNINFNQSKDITKKIEVLFLLYDRQCEDKNLRTHLSKLNLLNHYIKTLVDKEEFELALAFIERRKRKLFKYKQLRRKLDWKTIYRFNIIKIKQFFRTTN